MVNRGIFQRKEPTLVLTTKDVSPLLFVLILAMYGL
jgi:hypothetical protein